MIANLVGDDWYKLAKSVAIELSGGNQETPSIGEESLGDVIAVINTIDEDRITTEELINKLCQNDEKAWLNFNRGKRITPSQLGKMLRPFNITSSTIRFNEVTKKGYYLIDFLDVIERYVPVSLAES